jgi:hypothetical protein
MDSSIAWQPSCAASALDPQPLTAFSTISNACATASPKTLKRFLSNSRQINVLRDLHPFSRIP